MTEEFANLLGTLVTAAATVGLAFFGGVQLHQMRHDSRERKRAAFASIYAEYFRLSILSDSWADEDLLERSRNDALVPDDLKPRDWGTLIQLLGEVSSVTGALGGVAYELLGETTAHARTLNHILRTYPPGVIEEPARVLEKQIKKGVKGAAQIFEDAMRSAPSWLTTHAITVVDPKSEFGKQLQRQMVEAQKRVAGRRDTARLGGVGRWIGRRLANLALWFDPANEGRFTLVVKEKRTREQ